MVLAAAAGTANTSFVRIVAENLLDLGAEESCFSSDVCACGEISDAVSNSQLP
jgi:hypothetical protein